MPRCTQAADDKALGAASGPQDVGTHIVSEKLNRPHRNKPDHCMETQTLSTKDNMVLASGSNGTSTATLVECVEAAPVTDDSHTIDRVAAEWAKALDEQWAAAWASVGKPPPGSLPDTSVGASMQGSAVEYALGAKACWQPSLSDEVPPTPPSHVCLTEAMPALVSRDEMAQQLGDVKSGMQTESRPCCASTAARLCLDGAGAASPWSAALATPTFSFGAHLLAPAHE